MGMRNIYAALQADKIGPEAKMVLIAMSAHALDNAVNDTPARVYWGGHALLCAAFGRLPNASELRTIRRHIRTLEIAGYITRETRAGRTNKASYSLHLPGVTVVDNPVDNPPVRGPGIGH